MSTQLLEPETELVQEAPARRGLTFDVATQRRIDVAEAVASTLEDLSGTRAWDRLDPAIQRHLLSQGGRLGDHVAQLGTQRAVKSVEDVMLRLKRLERRLQIVVDELSPEEAAARAKSVLFLGDFTEIEIEPGGGKSGRTAPGRKAERRKAGPTLREGVTRLRTKAEKAAARASSRRVTFYVLGGLLTCVAAIGWNIKESLGETRHLERSPERAFVTNGYLKEMNIFLPATFTALRDREIRVVVSREWLLRPEPRRHQDAEGAYTWLSNRNVVKMLLTFEDGTPLLTRDEKGATWFDLQRPGKLPGEPVSR